MGFYLGTATLASVKWNLMRWAYSSEEPNTTSCDKQPCRVCLTPTCTSAYDPLSHLPLKRAAQETSPALIADTLHVSGLSLSYAHLTTNTNTHTHTHKEQAGERQSPWPWLYVAWQMNCASQQHQHYLSPGRFFCFTGAGKPSQTWLFFATPLDCVTRSLCIWQLIILSRVAAAADWLKKLKDLRILTQEWGWESSHMKAPGKHSTETLKLLSGEEPQKITRKATAMVTRHISYEGKPFHGPRAVGLSDTISRFASFIARQRAGR